ncbi:hypothetical protein B0H13DRAFT_1902114 [Mycena leptocephala]|nr:hypothetical protein B0H13DRAFT_1902114 [Mycena leptocephala]
MTEIGGLIGQLLPAKCRHRRLHRDSDTAAHQAQAKGCVPYSILLRFPSQARSRPRAPSRPLIGRTLPACSKLDGKLLCCLLASPTHPLRHRRRAQRTHAPLARLLRAASRGRTVCGRYGAGGSGVGKGAGWVWEDKAKGKKEKESGEKEKQNEEEHAHEPDEQLPFPLHDIMLSISRSTLAAIVGVWGAARRVCCRVSLGCAPPIPGAVGVDTEWDFGECLCATRVEGDGRLMMGIWGLDGGEQKQRVNIARALYYGTDVVTLDDPLSAGTLPHLIYLIKSLIVDDNPQSTPKSARRSSIVLVAQGKPVLQVTHALHFLVQCDYIYTLDHGRIAKAGTYPELIARGGEFPGSIGLQPCRKITETRAVNTVTDPYRQALDTILYGTGTVRVRPYTGGKAADGIPWINSRIIDPRSNIWHTQEASAHEESITECSEMFNFHDGYGRNYAVTGRTGGTRAVRASAPWFYGRLNPTPPIFILLSIVRHFVGAEQLDRSKHVHTYDSEAVFATSSSALHIRRPSRPNPFLGGQGGPGGQGHPHGTGGPGGAGLGPTVHITTHPLIPSNLDATRASEQASQLSKIRASHIGIHCPPPSRIFQGRRDILHKMHHFFTSNMGIQKIYLLHGLGGAGKTQIALKFINESSSRTIATIDAGLKNIAIMKESGNSQQDGLLWLTSRVEEWLLVFDNTDDPSINLNDFIPQCNHGNIIITSRNPGLHIYAGSRSLISDMEAEDAVALLLKSAVQQTTIGTEQIAAEIVKALHYLPLAIVQAGAFISKSQDLDSYLVLYTNNQARLLSEKPDQSHDCYAWTVYTTWQMSFDQLSPPAAMLLQHCSFLHHNGISERIFSLASKYTFEFDGPSEEELQETWEFLSHFLWPTGEWDSLQFSFVMNEIRAYSLINFDAERKLFSIHPLVHAWSQAAVCSPERYMSRIGSILGMAISECPEQDIQLESLGLCPHVELAVQSGAEVAPVFRCYYGLIFWGAGKYKQYETLLGEVLEEQKQILGDNHPDTLCTMGNLANAYSELGEHQKAKELNVIVIEKRKQFLGDNHPDTLRTIGNLANTYSHLGEHRRAKELRVIVMEKRKQFLGDNHPDTLCTMGNLASAYSDLGEHQKAKELNVIVIEKRKQFLGDNHPDTLRTIGNLANTYSHLGEHRRAKELKVIVMEKRQQFLGDNHPDTLWTMGNLASTYSYLGEHRKAKELKVIVMEKQKQFLGDNHPDTLRTMGNLASTYSDLGEHRQAKELSMIVMEKQKQFLGDNHPDTLRTIGNLANTYSDLGEHRKAEELGVIVMEKKKQFLGDNHPDTLRTIGNLASTYSDLGEHRKAEAFKVIVMEKQKQFLGDNHPDTLHTMGNLANTYSDLGEHQKAKELKHQKAKELGMIVMEKRKQFLGDNHPDTLRTIGNLASAYSDLGEHRKAKELKVIVMEKQKQFLGDNHPDTLWTMGNLANTYSDLGEHPKAKELKVIVMEKQKQFLGDNHPDTLWTMGNLANTYSDLGEHPKAKELKVIVMEKQKQFLSDNHPDPLCTMGNLATIQSQGDLSDSTNSILPKGISVPDHPFILRLIARMRDKTVDRTEPDAGVD